MEKSIFLPSPSNSVLVEQQVHVSRTDKGHLQNVAPHVILSGKDGLLLLPKSP